MKLTKAHYTAGATARSQQGAEDWLADHEEGHPRSWDQESANASRCDYEMYERDFEAPPIAGYEALETKGYVERRAIIRRSGQERVQFVLTDAGRAALRELKGGE